MTKTEKVVKEEREWFKSLLNQMKDIHSGNKSVVTVLDFLEDCLEQRGK